MGNYNTNFLLFSETLLIFAPVLCAISDSSSVGRAQPCQGWGREFESRLSLIPLSIHLSVFVPVFFFFFAKFGTKNDNISLYLYL